MDDKIKKELTKPFSKDEVKPAPRGKFGSYVPHHLVTKRLNKFAYGQWSHILKEVVRDKDNSVRAVVTTFTLFGVSHDEIGDVDNNDVGNKNTEGELLKLCMSDALKRGAMRHGIGLHLWTGETTEEEHYANKNSSITQATQQSESEVMETKSVQVTEQKRKSSPGSDEIAKVAKDSLKNTKRVIDYIKNVLLFKYGLTEKEEQRMIKELVNYGKQRMLKKDDSVETYTDSEMDKLLDKIALHFEKNGESMMDIAQDELLSLVSSAGLEPEIKQENKKEEEVIDIPEGKWMQDPMTDAQSNFILNTLVPECIDAGQDKIAQEAKGLVEGGQLSKGDASDLITKLKEAKSK
jgi:hypothetical protein